MVCQRASNETFQKLRIEDRTSHRVHVLERQTFVADCLKMKPNGHLDLSEHSKTLTDIVLNPLPYPQ
jgi:hypothetical protein